MFGKGWSVRFPFALLSALTTVGYRAFTAEKSMYILCLRGSPSADFFGTTMTGLAHRETFLVMMPVLSKLSILRLTNFTVPNCNA